MSASPLSTRQLLTEPMNAVISTRRPQHGFTLVELLVAITVAV
jgi:prepilin-type N-terminal cleavage/methylation domain-containing protein